MGIIFWKFKFYEPKTYWKKNLEKICKFEKKKFNKISKTKKNLGKIPEKFLSLKKNPWAQKIKKY